jgi:hypothetical protein
VVYIYPKPQEKLKVLILVIYRRQEAEGSDPSLPLRQGHEEAEDGETGEEEKTLSTPHSLFP